MFDVHFDVHIAPALLALVDSGLGSGLRIVIKFPQASVWLRRW